MEDFEGRVIDIEIQRVDRGAGVRRARFHSSMIDRTLLAKGEDFEELAYTYVIFITENDKFGAGTPLYHIERTIEEKDHQGVGDGAHIIYVNGSFRNQDYPIGRLMYDFHCQKAAEEAAAKTAVTAEKRMLERGRDTCEEIAELLELPVEEVQKLKKEMDSSF